MYWRCCKAKSNEHLLSIHGGVCGQGGEGGEHWSPYHMFVFFLSFQAPHVAAGGKSCDNIRCFLQRRVAGYASLSKKCCHFLVF